MKFFFILFLILFSVTSKAQITFEKKIRGYNLYNVQQTKDKGYIMGGSKGNTACLIKTDTIGDTLWIKNYKVIGVATRGVYVNQIKNGGYILAGSVYGFGAGSYDVLLIKTDTSGNVLWSKSYGGAVSDSAIFVQQTTDGGFVIAAITRSFGAGGSDIYIVKTDSLGAMQWTKTYGTTNDESITSLQQTTDGGYIISGANSAFFLLKTNALGDTVWAKTYTVVSGNNLVRGYCLQVKDGSYIVCANNVYNTFSSVTYYFKTDSIGNIAWAKNVSQLYCVGGLSAYSGNIQQTADGGYIFSNNVIGSCSFNGQSYPTGGNNVYKVDSVGQAQWTNSYDGSAQLGFINVYKNTDTTCVVLQSLDSNTCLLVKTNRNGNITCSSSTTPTINTINISPSYISFTVSSGGASSNIPTQVTSGVITYTTVCSSVTTISTYSTQHTTFKIYPNPAQNNFTVEVSNNEKQTLQLFDVNGKLVLLQTINGTTNIDVSNLNAGVYSVNITNTQGFINKRLVIVR